MRAAVVGVRVAALGRTADTDARLDVGLDERTAAEIGVVADTMDRTATVGRGWGGKDGGRNERCEKECGPHFAV